MDYTISFDANWCKDAKTECIRLYPACLCAHSGRLLQTELLEKLMIIQKHSRSVLSLKWMNNMIQSKTMINKFVTWRGCLCDGLVNGNTAQLKHRSLQIEVYKSINKWTFVSRQFRGGIVCYFMKPGGSSHSLLWHCGFPYLNAFHRWSKE